MKHFLLTTSMLLVVTTASAQQTFLSCGFDNGIPECFKTYDNDGNEPSTDMKALGFAKGIAWVATPDKDGNMAACSTSWYRTAGTSDDWMVTPAITPAKGALLRWRGKAGDKDYRDGYSVYISESGNRPEDFDTSAPAFSEAKEKSQWTDHEIDLGEYAGKTIYIAFVNNTRDMSTLWIDDITVGVPASLEVTSGIPRVIEKAGKIAISGIVKNTSDHQIDGFDVTCVFNEKAPQKMHFDKKVSAGGSNSFYFESEYEINLNQTAEYTLTVETGGESSSAGGKVSAYRRRIVAEEITGTWCGFCIRGIVAMEGMHESFGDSFLGIAVHNGSNGWADPMAMPEYTEWLMSKFNMSGYPNTTVNRMITTTGDPENIYNYYVSQLAKEHYTGIALEAELENESRILTAKATLYSSRDIEDSNLKFAYVIIENDVHCDDIIYNDKGEPKEFNGWEQNNYYAGGANGEMGGFEDMPERIPGRDMWYQDVARYITEGFNGIDGSLPEFIKENTAVSHEETIVLPETIMNDENTELAVLLINGKTDEIINAEVLPLKNHFTPDSIDETMSSDADITFHTSGRRVSALSPNGIKSLSIYSTDGTCVTSSDAGDTEITIDITSAGGMYIAVATSLNGERRIKKVII